MKGLSKFLGRGLLVLALGSCFVACGDDDDDATTDGGAGMSGSGGKGGASGAGGKGGASGKGGAAGGAGTVAPKCEDTAEAMSDTAVETSAACITCVCDKSEAATIACTGDCWKLAYCVVENGCEATDTTCITNACTDDLGTTTKLAAAGALAMKVNFAGCAAQCFVEPDGGN
jgi:hypothetical protein